MGKPAPTLRAGEVFAERYRIERLLGRGGMGEVYAALDTELNDRVALKVLLPRAGANPRLVGRFQREVRLSRRVTSPNVARTYAFGEAGVHYLTMELIDGHSLRQRLKRDGALPIAEVVRIGGAICRGLASAHDAGVLHRDLKPANVMLSEDRVLLTDFGIARSREPLAGDQVETVGFIGTPRYAAPEVFDGSAFDERSDLYAVGVMLMEMVTGKPYRLAQIAEHDPTRVEDATPSHDGVPAELDALMRKLVSLAPERRPARASEVEAALADVGTVEASAPAKEESAAAAPIPQWGSRLLILPLSARGDDSEEFAEVLSEELVDLLSHNADLQVVAHRAEGDEDPAATGRRVGAEWTVHGSVMRKGPRMRVSIRLVDVRTGQQLHSERFDAEIADVFELQDRIARKIGEALRVEVTLVAKRGDADAIAVESYLRGRRLLMSPKVRAGIALADLEEAIARAPGFGVARAAYAIATVQTWFYLGARPEGRIHAERAKAAVEKALEVAPGIAESHLAAGMYAAQAGDYPGAVDALRHCLTIAPTCAAAHEYLGMLECEAGRGHHGVERIELAHELNPELTSGHLPIARWHALMGNVDRAIAVLDEQDRKHGLGIGRLTQRIRIAAWYGDREMLAQSRDLLEVREIPEMVRFADYANVVLGNVTIEEVFSGADSEIEDSSNNRFRTLVCQVSAEACGLGGDHERALSYIERAADLALADISWLTRCPALEGVRTLPGFETMTHRVHDNAAAIWNV